MSLFKNKSPDRQPESESPSDKEVLGYLLAAMKGVMANEASPRRIKGPRGLIKKLDKIIAAWPLTLEQKKVLTTFFARQQYQSGFKPEHLGDSQVLEGLKEQLDKMEGIEKNVAKSVVSIIGAVIRHNLKEKQLESYSDEVDLRDELKALARESNVKPELKRTVRNLLYLIKPERLKEEWPTAEEVLERSRSSRQKRQAKPRPASQPKAVKSKAAETETPQEKISSVSSWINQGNHSLLLRRYKEAIRAFKTALREDPESSMAANALKETYLQLAERDEGLAVLVAETAGDPRDALANMYVGMTSLQRNDFRIAKIYYLKALGLSQALESEISAALRNRQLLEKSKETKGEENDLAAISELIQRIFPAKPDPEPAPDARFRPQGISGVPESRKTPAEEVVPPAAMSPIEQLFDEDEAEDKGFDWGNHDQTQVSYSDEELAEIVEELGWGVKPADTARPALGVDDWRDEVELAEGQSEPAEMPSPGLADLSSVDPTEHIVKGYINQGEVHMKKGEWKEAEKAFGWALKRASESTLSATVIVGYIQQRLGEVKLKREEGEGGTSDESLRSQFDEAYAVISDTVADEEELRQAIIDYHRLREENRSFPFDHFEVAIRLREHLIDCNITIITPEIIIGAHRWDIFTRNRLRVPSEQLYRSHAECGLTFEKLGDREGEQKNWPLAFDYFKKAHAQYQYAHRLMQQSSDPDHDYAWVEERAEAIGRKVKKPMKEKSE